MNEGHVFMQSAITIAKNSELDDYSNFATLITALYVLQVGNPIRHSFSITQLGSDIRNTSRTRSRFMLMKVKSRMNIEQTNVG